MAGPVLLLPPDSADSRREGQAQSEQVAQRPEGQTGLTHACPVRLFLPDVEATLALGRAMAQSLPEGWGTPMALLRGGLGSGKTTLARGLVSALPGCENAEVASPSFNLANVYPTTPSVVHLDLYRLGEGGFGADLDEFLEGLPSGGTRVVLVEWAEYLPSACHPADALDIFWKEVPEGREVCLCPCGPFSHAWLEAMCRNVLQSEHP